MVWMCVCVDLTLADKAGRQEETCLVRNLPEPWQVWTRVYV